MKKIITGADCVLDSSLAVSLASHGLVALHGAAAGVIRAMPMGWLLEIIITLKSGGTKEEIWKKGKLVP